MIRGFVTWHVRMAVGMGTKDVEFSVGDNPQEFDEPTLKVIFLKNRSFRM